MRIIFTGGGTLGPVTPLLAVAEEVRCQVSGVSVVWIGTRWGPERKLVEEAGIQFSWIWTPKWRRYFDVWNLFVPFALLVATKIAWFKLLRMRPDVIITAGGYVGVPVVWAGWFLRIPSVLHNQDVRWSLANKLVVPFVKCITYTLPGTVPARWKHKAVWTGNPVRTTVLKGNNARGLKICGFHDRVPTILVVGGGTGAKRLNEIVWEALPELTKKYRVIHVTGKGKNHGSWNMEQGTNRYCAFEFVTSEMGDLLAAADLVITRAGMGVLTECAALGKPMIIVPIPGSHQEDNARYFNGKGAAIALNQEELNGEKLFKSVEHQMQNVSQAKESVKHLRELSRSNAAKKIAQKILTLAKP